MNSQSSSSVNREFMVINDLGIHARVAAKIASKVQEFDCEVTLSKGDISVEGDSVLSILTLDAPKGTALQASAQGPQAVEALDALEAMFVSGFGDI